MTAGRHMRAEIAEAPGVFAKAFETAISTKAHRTLNELSLPQIVALYTIARGSSDAAANILSYEFMRELGKPMTSLPPSVFSVGHGVGLANTLAVLVSQSGASEDLVRSAKGARDSGAMVIAITNQPKSPVESHANLTLSVGAGPELAVPATKTVIGSIAAGMALLAVLNPLYNSRARAAAKAVAASGSRPHPQAATIAKALTEASHVYVIGRDTGYGAAQELALKIKETCALHAEAYSASEVLHGPLQLATKPLLTLILDTGTLDTQTSLDTAENRLRTIGGPVFRLRPMDVEASGLTPAAAAALLLCVTYPIVLETALALGHDPDRPATLSKVTQTT
jgi:glucosamine--fructose-6-phosphate aminotransferase (isomerizing)